MLGTSGFGIFFGSANFSGLECTFLSEEKIFRGRKKGWANFALVRFMPTQCWKHLYWTLCKQVMDPVQFQGSSAGRIPQPGTVSQLTWAAWTTGMYLTPSSLVCHRMLFVPATVCKDLSMDRKMQLLFPFIQDTLVWAAGGLADPVSVESNTNCTDNKEDGLVYRPWMETLWNCCTQGFSFVFVGWSLRTIGAVRVCVFKSSPFAEGREGTGTSLFSAWLWYKRRHVCIQNLCVFIIIAISSWGLPDKTWLFLIY